MGKIFNMWLLGFYWGCVMIVIVVVFVIVNEDEFFVLGEYFCVIGLFLECVGVEIVKCFIVNEVVVGYCFVKIVMIVKYFNCVVVESVFGSFEY